MFNNNMLTEAYETLLHPYKLRTSQGGPSSHQGLDGGKSRIIMLIGQCAEMILQVDLEVNTYVCVRHIAMYCLF